MQNEFIHAYQEGSKIRIISSNKQVESIDSTYSFFVECKYVDDDLLSELRASRFFTKVAQEGLYYRIDVKPKYEFQHKIRKVIAFDEDSIFVQREIPIYEADISPLLRFLVDNPLDLKLKLPRYAFLDIETDSRVPFSKKERATILSWVVVKDDGTVKKGLLKEFNQRAEKELLQEFWEAVKDTPLLLAWNGGDGFSSLGFDFPVIRSRTFLLDVKVEPRNWLYLDAMLLYKKFNVASESGEEKTSYRLEAIAQHLLGYGKDDFDASKTWEEYEKGQEAKERLLEYNVKDTLLLRDIEKKTGFLKLFFSICEVCGIFPETKSLDSTRQMDGFMLRLGKEHNFRYLTKRPLKKGEQFKGAYVMEPKTEGIEKQVHVADFASLYPSIILTWNMSPETKVPSYFKGDFCKAPSTGICFRTDKEGLLPIALKQLILMRKEWNQKKSSLAPGTEDWKEADRKSTAYKVIANSFYGVIGSFFSRYYDKEIAESVTQTGVYLIKKTIEKAEKEGLKVVYGDSITGDRTVVLKNKQGWIEIDSIENFWKKVSFIKEERNKQFGYLEGYSVLSHQGYKPLKCLIRHYTDKSVYLLSTKHGQVKVTEDHSLVIAGKSVSPKEFLDKKLVFTKVEVSTEKEIEVIDILEYINHFKVENLYKKTIVVRKFEADNEFIYLAGWGNYKTCKIKRYYKKDTEEYKALVRLVTFYVSDGSASLRGVTTSRFVLSFCKNNLKWMHQVKRDLLLISEGLDITGPFWSDTVYIVRSGTALFSCFFAALCCYKSKDKKLPSFLFNMNNKIFKLFYEVLTLGDGHIDISNQLKFECISQTLIAGISYIFSQHGIRHSFSYRSDKKSFSIRTRGSSEFNSIKENCIGTSRYTIKQEVSLNYSDYVYDLSVQEAETFVDGMGQVLLHNTDSAFLSNISEQGFRAFVKNCNDDLYPAILKESDCKINTIRLDYEKAFERIVFTSAKRYCGKYLHYKGKRAEQASKPEIKGLEYKRGDTNLIARNMQFDVITALLEGQERPSFYRDLLDGYMHKVMKGSLLKEEVMKSAAVTKELTAYSQKTKKDGNLSTLPAHIQVAKQMQERGQSVSEGTKIEYFIEDGHPKRPRKVESIDFFEEDKVDRYFLWEHFVYPPTQRLLQAAFPHEDWKQGYEKIRPKEAIVRKPRKKRGQEPLFQGNLFQKEVQEDEILISLNEKMKDKMLDLKKIILKHPGGKRVRLQLHIKENVIDFDVLQWAVCGSDSFYKALEKWKKKCV